MALSPLEILHTNSRKVSCDGNRDSKSASSGHPLIYLDMGKKDSVICPYCGKFFKLQKERSLKTLYKHT